MDRLANVPGFKLESSEFRDGFLSMFSLEDVTCNMVEMREKQVVIF